MLLINCGLFVQRSSEGRGVEVRRGEGVWGMCVRVRRDRVVSSEEKRAAVRRGEGVGKRWVKVRLEEVMWTVEVR